MSNKNGQIAFERVFKVHLVAGGYGRGANHDRDAVAAPARNRRTPVSKPGQSPRF